MIDHYNYYFLCYHFIDIHWSIYFLSIFSILYILYYFLYSFYFFYLDSFNFFSIIFNVRMTWPDSTLNLLLFILTEYNSIQFKTVIQLNRYSIFDKISILFSSSSSCKFFFQSFIYSFKSLIQTFSLPSFSSWILLLQSFVCFNGKIILFNSKFLFYCFFIIGIH